MQIALKSIAHPVRVAAPYRPFVLTLIAVTYGLLPFVSLVLTRMQFRFGGWKYALAAYSVPALLLLVSAPVVAYGLFRVRPWAYRVFLIHALALIGYNVFLAVRYGNLAYAGSLTQSVIGLLAVWYVLRREVSAPYLSYIPRGFRRRKRADISTGVAIQGARFVTRDLSEVGCFLPPPIDESSVWSDFSPGRRLELQLELHEGPLPLSARIIRADELGAGIQFLNTRSDRRRIGTFIKEVFPDRLQVDLPVVLEAGRSSTACRALNISKSGAYLALPPEATDDLPHEFHVNLNEPTPLRIQSVLSWKNPGGRFGKHPGIGVRFIRFDNPRAFSKFFARIKRTAEVAR